MKQYDKMKDSGIEWIGQIPVGWNILPLKRVVKEPLMYGANEAANDSLKEDPRYLRITDFDKSGNLRGNTYKSLPIKKAKDYLLEEGDILFARSGATVGKTFQFKNYKGLACFAGYLIKATPSNKILSDFLYFYTKSGPYEEWKGSIFNQATIQNIGADKYNLLPVPTPPISEQSQIVSFLDDKTAKIDSLIEKKQRKIELLREKRKALINHAVTKGLNPDAPMKDSGVEWIGEIPEDWRVKKLKYISYVRPSNVDKHIYENEIPVKLCNYTDVYYNEKLDSSESFKNGSVTEKEKEKFHIQKGDIILTKDSETADDIGVPVYINRDIENSVCAYHLTQISPNVNECLGEFIFRFIQSEIVRHFFEIEANGITRFGLSKSSIENLYVPIPPSIVQSEIINKVNSETKEIDALITKENKKIELLKEYRQALISEAVTGKIDVRDYAKVSANAADKSSEEEKEAAA